MSLVSLDPARTWQDAFDELARHRGVIGRALAAPAAAIVIANLAVTMPDVGPATLFLTSLLSYAAYLMVAVSCHRILLLGEDSLPNEWGVYLGRRELRFVGWSLVIGLIAAPIFLVVAAVLSAFYGLEPSDPLAIATMTIVGLVACAYPVSRSSLVLPATAIDERPTIAGAWALSDGVGWPLALIVSLPGIAATVLDLGVGLLLPSGPGTNLVGSVLYLGFEVFGIAALSIASFSL